LNGPWLRLFRPHLTNDVPLVQGQPVNHRKELYPGSKVDRCQPRPG
jgi:hypothetical protein